MSAHHNQQSDHYPMRWEEWNDDVDKERYSELYVLVDPSRYPERLGKMLSNSGIPFVHWGFAKARIEYGQPRELGDVVLSLSALLFVRGWNGDPWKFYVHPHFSVPRYQYLRRAIEVYSYSHSHDYHHESLHRNVAES
jgi:hypothetical protein